MKIALVQQHATRVREENMARGLASFEKSVSEGADLVVYPELGFDYFIPQFPSSDNFRKLAEPIPGPITEAFCEKAEYLRAAAVVNLYELDCDGTYDTTAIIDSSGEIIGKNRMVHIYEGPQFHEKGYYAPGNLGAGVFEMEECRVGVAICYDRHFPEYMRALALKGAELVVIPQAGAVDEWPSGLFEAEVRTAAFQNGYFAALVNRVGDEEMVSFAGESFVCDPSGEIIARAPKGKDYVLYAKIDFAKVATSHARRHFLPDRRPRTYIDLIYEL